MGQTPQRISAYKMLRARATIARRQVRDCLMLPEDALAYAVWPTGEIERVETFLPRGTVATRAYGPRADN